MISYALKNDFTKARTFHYKLLSLMELLLTMNNPSGIKSVLSIIDLCENYMRLPLVPISKSNISKLQELVKDVKTLDLV